MTEEKKPEGWKLALSVIGGIIAIIIGIVALFFPVGTTITILYLFLIGLIILGVMGIIKGFTDKKASTGMRTLNLLIGALVIIVACVGLFYPGWSTIFIVYFISIGFMIWGFWGMFLGFAASQAPGGSRAALIILGILAIIISSVIFWNPLVGVAFMVVAFSFVLMFAGIQLIMAGVK